MNYKSLIFSALANTPKVIGNNNKALFVTSDNLISGIQLEDPSELSDSPVYEELYKAFLKEEKESVKLISELSKKVDFDKTAEDKLRTETLSSQNELIYLKDVTIQAISTGREASIPFLVLDSSKIIGMTIGTASKG